jgi:hypothetical protein
MLPMVLDEIEVGESLATGLEANIPKSSRAWSADYQNLKRGFTVDEIRGCSVLEDS